MKKYIHSLRQKPEHIRKKVAFLISLTLSAIIFVVWVSTLSVSPTARVVAQDENPIKVIGDNVANVYDSIKGDVETIKVYTDELKKLEQ